MVVGLTHPDRLGGDAIASINSSRAASSITTDKTNAASTSSIAGKGYFCSLCRYFLLYFQYISLPSFNAYFQPEDLLNPLLMASLMTNPLAMQTLLMDPTTLAAMSLAGASTTSSSTGTSCKKSKAPPNSQS
uniref:Uncharacterized protein n=1 Tax=Heterorhabditis bacteriophora TaxID=37862 RepID=A0A1I7WFW7_HETBA